MSYNHFEEKNKQRFLLHADNSPYNYKTNFWWMRELIVKWKRNMINKFSLPRIACVDESMVTFLIPYAPGWVTVKRKSHPMDNRYHTVAYADTKMLWVCANSGGALKDWSNPNLILYQNCFAIHSVEYCSASLYLATC